MLAANRQCIDRAGRNAGATASTAFRINLGKGATAKARCEANGAGVAKVAANTTFNSLQRQAGRADKRFVGPR